MVHKVESEPNFDDFRLDRSYSEAFNPHRGNTLDISEIVPERKADDDGLSFSMHVFEDNLKQNKLT